MALKTTEAMRLLAELTELDYQLRERKMTLTPTQRTRREMISRELQRWTLQGEATVANLHRRHPRAALSIGVQLLGGPSPIVLASDSLAVGGLSVTLPYVPHVGDLIALQLSPPAPDEPFEATGEVVWHDPRANRVGLRFVDLPKTGRELIERLVFTRLVAK